MRSMDEREQHWQRLMKAAQSGDEASYHLLLGELSSVIERYLRRHFGHLPFEEDCVQEALIRLHHARHTWQPTRRFGPWLFAIVRHTAIDVIRKGQRYRRAVESWHETKEMLEDSPPQIPANESSEQLDVMFRRLSPGLRDALILTRIDGCTAREAAESLGISATAVKVRCHRAIAQLRAQLRAETTEAAFDGE